LHVTGGLTLDGAAGTSGQALVSAGSSNTPTWTTLGTIASQNANAVAITGGTIAGATVNTYTVGANSVGARTVQAVSAGTPTGGSNGDIVYQY
jgi:hypothetical protein